MHPLRVPVLALVLASGLGAAAPARLREEGVSFRMLQMEGPPGRPERLRIAGGARHGIRPGARGEILALTKEGVKVVGRAEAVEVEELAAWVKVVPEAGSDLGRLAGGGVVTLRVLVPEGMHRGVLWDLYAQGIRFLDNAKQPLVSFEDLLEASDERREREVLKAMVACGLEVVAFTTELKQKVTHGPWSGKVCAEVLRGSTPEDYLAFLRFVRSYPGKYLGKDWKISETYATWIINDMPLAMEDLAAELQALGLTPALDARVAGLKASDLNTLFTHFRKAVGALPQARRDEAKALLALLDRMLAARPQAGAFLHGEGEQARAQWLEKDRKTWLEAAAAHGRAAEWFLKVPAGEERSAPLDAMVCRNNQANVLEAAGKPDEALAIAVQVRGMLPAFEAALDPEIAAHARLSEAYAINLCARIANQRGDYRKVVAELTPLVDRYRAVGAPGFRQKEIDLLQFLAKAHERLGEIDTAAALLERAARTADELKDLATQARIAWAIGDLHWGASRFEAAAADYQRSADRAREAGDLKALAKALAASGQALWSLGKPKEALGRHAEAMKVREALKDDSGIAWQLTQVGKIQVDLGDREAAAADLGRALAIYQRLKEEGEAAQTYRERGRLWIALSRTEDAEADYRAAREIYRGLKRAPDEAWSLLGMGWARAIRHDFAGAVALVREAQAIADRTEDRELRVRSRLVLCDWLKELGGHAESRTLLEEALAQVGQDPGLRADVLLRRSGVRQSEGDLRGAEADAEASIQLAVAQKDLTRQLKARLARANLHMARGEYASGLSLLDTVAGAARTGGNRPLLAEALQSKGWRLAMAGRLTEARELADASLALRDPKSDEVERAWGLNLLAEIAAFHGDVREQLRLYGEGLALMRKAGYRFGEAGLTFNRANVFFNLRDFDEALKGADEAQRLVGANSTFELDLVIQHLRGQILGQLQRFDEADAAFAAALEKARAGLPDRVPEVLAQRGRLLALRGAYDRALPLLKEAADTTDQRGRGRFSELGELGIAQARAGRPEALATLRETLARAERAGGALPWEPAYHLGRLLADKGEVREALAILERAAREIEKGEVVLASEVAKNRYWGDKAGVYTLLVKLLLSQNRVGDALKFVERAKAAELEDLRRQSGGRDGDLGLELEIAESRFAEELRLEQAKASPDAEKLRRLDDLLTDVRRRRADYIDQLDRSLGGQPGARRDVYAIRPLELEKLQEYVTPGMLVLSPVVLENKLVVFAVTHEAITHFDTDLPAAELDQLVAAVLAEVAPGKAATRGAGLEGEGPEPSRGEASLARLKAPAGRLYDLLLRQAVARFGMPKTLVLSASGSLRYLPFAALHDGTDWLVQRTELISVTALDQQKFATPGRKAPGPARVLALADPDGSLPGALREVADLKGAFGDVQVLEGGQATLAAFRQQIETPGFDIVHLATHGRLDGARPEQSHILLAGSSLYYRDIPALRFSRTNLVVLSACDTASRSNGAEVTGLAYQFERTKVRGVIATLWPVDDRATALLMKDFYRRVRSGEGYARALAGAQAALAGQARFSHPTFWAPFLLIGAP